MPLAIWTPGAMELIVVLVIGLVLFGGNLPEVGRSLGKGLTEFRKGLKDLKQESGFDEIEKARDDLLDSARTIDPRRMLDEEPPDAEFHAPSTTTRATTVSTPRSRASGARRSDEEARNPARPMTKLNSGGRGGRGRRRAADLRLRAPDLSHAAPCATARRRALGAPPGASGSGLTRFPAA
ncbi:MAG: twin-arginine translocase TatA/TatE family subunit [Planctomycetota bacterium]